MELIAGEIYDIINIRGWEDHTFEFKAVRDGRIRGVHIYPNGDRYITRNFCNVFDATQYLKPTFAKDSNIPEIW